MKKKSIVGYRVLITILFLLQYLRQRSNFVPSVQIDSKLAVKVPQLWEAYLERFADMNEDIRKICIQHISDFLIQQAGSVSELTSSSNNNTISATAGSSNLHHHHAAPMSSALVLEQIIEQVRNRSLDPDEGLRHEVIQEILKAIKSDANLISSDLLNILQKRTLDVKVSLIA